MLALHALWSPGRGICLWAEDPALPARSTSRAGRRQARPHPFAVPAERLATVLGTPVATPGVAVLALPSGPDAPRGSEDQHDPVLSDWTVPVLELAPGAAPPPAPDGVRASPSVTALGAVDVLAADLVVRGRLLPTPDPERGLAWRPVLQGPDLVAADALAAALPPVARCERVPGEETLAAPEVVDAALTAAVDARARARLTGSTELAAAPDWAHALGDAPVLGGTLPPGLADGLGRWTVAGAPHAGPARASFRLADVDVDHLGHALDDVEPTFRLHIALQSTQDPSLTVDADAVWREPGALRRWLDDPPGLLRAELERAATVVPDLADGLLAPRAAAVDLDLAGAHHFLAHAAVDLDRAGFGVLLPAGWRTGTAGLGLLGAGGGRPERPDGVVVTAARIRRADLVDFHWRLAVDGEGLTDAEMDALARAKAPLVRRRGRWVAVDPGRLAEALRFLERHRARQGAGEVARLALAGPDAASVPLPVESITLEGPLADLAQGSLEPVAVPDGVTATLRPYQRSGLSWLVFLARLGIGGVLADDMGLGKTLQVLALEVADRDDDPDGATLLVCPTSVVSTWRDEAARFTPSLRVAVHHGPGRADAERLPALAAGADLVVTSYGTLVRDVDALARVDFRRVVLDEAQAVKNNRARAARAVRRMRAEHRLALTGTPLENRLAELWSIMDAVNPGMLGTAGAFRERYAVPVERHGRTDVAAALRERVRPVLLRRVKTDPDVAADLPERIETVEHCPLTAEQASLYRAVVDDLLTRLGERDDPARRARRRGRVLGAMTRLKQICDHPALMLGDGSPVARRSGKVARLEEIVEEVLAAGERALMFTQFAAFGHMLAPHLAARFDTEVAWLHGGTSRAARDAMVERFQRGDGPPLFLLSLRAGGTGITLTAAQHVVHLDRWWNPAVEDQATDRAHRIGQRHAVGVRKLVCTGTLEERIEDVVAGKRELAGLTVPDGTGADDWLATLSTEDIARALALGPGGAPDDEDAGDGA